MLSFLPASPGPHRCCPAPPLRACAYCTAAVPCLPSIPSPHPAARQKLVDYIKRAAHTTLFDFPTKGILQVGAGLDGWA